MADPILPERKLVSKREAQASGLKRYFTGKPCKHGHVAERWATTAACYECVRSQNLVHSRIHKERYNTQSLKWNKDNPERRKAIYGRWAQPRAEHEKKRKRLWSKERYHAKYKYDPAHKRRARATAKQWAKENPDRMSVFSRACKAVRRSAIGRFTVKDVQSLLERQDCRCAASHCRIDVSAGFHCDHIMPLSRGGTNWPDNLQLLCPACNLSKGARTMEEWQAVLTKSTTDSILTSVV